MFKRIKAAIISLICLVTLATSIKASFLGKAIVGTAVGSAVGGAAARQAYGYPPYYPYRRPSVLGTALSGVSKVASGAFDTVKNFFSD